MNAQRAASKDRERLGFAEAVAEHIAPMLKVYGFNCIEATPYAVTFQSAEATLAVLHDRVSYELDVICARLADPRNRYSLANLVDAVLGPGHDEQTFFQASEHDSVIVAVRRIADILRRCGSLILAADLVTYRRIREVAGQQNEAHTKEVVQQPVRSKAEESWRRRDYAQVQRLYQSIEADLTTVERRRLEYARSRLKSV